MKRRQFLAISSGALGAVALSRCSVATLPSAGATVIQSQQGHLFADLKAQFDPVTLAGRQAYLKTYNQQIPGPRLEASAGDTVEIRFTNELEEPTNLHFHGLHIPPTGDADNAFREVSPGETVTYRFTIPADHPAGTFWYHPHYHGRVAEQIFNGMAGGFLIRGPLDEIPEVASAAEALLILQDFDLDRRGYLREPMPMLRMWGREGSLITANGQSQPTVDIPANGLLRLRLLNASAARYHQLRLKDHPWYQIGTDGGSLSSPVLSEDILLAPGERVEMLIAGDQTPGRYDLLSLPYDRGVFAMMGGMGGGMMGGRMRHSVGLTDPLPLAQMNYGAAGALATLPSQLIPVEPLPEPTVTRQFVLDHGMDAVTGAPFLINGQGFRHGEVNTQVQLDTVEEWEVINKAGMDHPFHLHTNAFQVIERNGQPEPYLAWKDVVNLKAYETVRIRVPFRDFAGQTVYHCHILDHEDQGMMGVIDMQPAGSGEPAA